MMIAPDQPPPRARRPTRRATGPDLEPWRGLGPDKRSEAVRLLAHALITRGLSRSDADRRLGLRCNHVSRLLIGHRLTASPKLRANARTEFGIPPDAWDVLARAGIPRVPRPSKSPRAALIDPREGR